MWSYQRNIFAVGNIDSYYSFSNFDLSLFQNKLVVVNITGYNTTGGMQCFTSISGISLNLTDGSTMVSIGMTESVGNNYINITLQTESPVPIHVDYIHIDIVAFNSIVLGSSSTFAYFYVSSFEMGTSYNLVNEGNLVSSTTMIGLASFRV
jgi:hypothetical protein